MEVETQLGLSCSPRMKHAIDASGAEVPTPAGTKQGRSDQTTIAIIIAMMTRCGLYTSIAKLDVRGKLNSKQSWPLCHCNAC